MGDLSPCALALLAVSEDNRRLRGYWQWEMRSRAVCLIEIDRLNREIAVLIDQLFDVAQSADDLDDGANLLDRVRAICAENSRLRADVAARDTALDACAERIANLIERRDALLVTVRNISQSTPLSAELEGWEGQRAALLAEVGTLRAARDEAERECDAAQAAAYEYGKRTGDLMTEIRTAERQVLALTERLAEVTDELATVQNDRGEADRSAASYRRGLLALQDRILELEAKLAVAHETRMRHRVQAARYVTIDSVLVDVIDRLDALVSSGAILGGARRILDEVRADLRTIVTKDPI